VKYSNTVVVHRGRAHVDDFLAACVCIHHTRFPLFRTDATLEMLNDSSCWVLDQGLRFDPELHNFDHHHLKDQICSLTMLLDHLYPEPYRQHIPQLQYIEIHDSVGSSKAAKFAGLPYEGLEIASSLIQQLMLKAFSSIEDRVPDSTYSFMSSIGSELCCRIEQMPSLFEQLNFGARLLDFSGMKVLDVTGCNAAEPDRLPTKSWCEKNGMSPSVILNRDPRNLGSYRMVSLDKSVRFICNPSCEYTHPSGFLTVFAKLDDWQNILSLAQSENKKSRP